MARSCVSKSWSAMTRNKLIDMAVREAMPRTPFCYDPENTDFICPACQGQIAFEVLEYWKHTASRTEENAG
jgi:hypothetical protein